LDAPTAESGVPTPPKQPGAPRRWFFAALPFVITALAAVAVSLLLQSMFLRPSLADFPLPTASASTPAPSLPTSAGAAPTARPIAAAPTALPLAQGISEQELADIRAEGDRKQAQIYLLLAIVQIDDAENALRSNELASVDQSLVAIDNSLNLAYARYERAGDSARDAVAQRRMEVGKLHDDLYLYPEGMDQRLNTLRQLTLALITEQQR
jgi:hypothetical protein